MTSRVREILKVIISIAAWYGMAIYLAGMLLTSGGCSATKRIAASASAVQQDVSDTTRSIEILSENAIEHLYAGDDSGVEQNLSAIQGEARGLRERTDKRAADIHRDLTGAKDRTPWWAGTVGLIAGCLIVVAIVFALWRSGILGALGGLIGLATPRKKRSTAVLLNDAIDERPGALQALAAQVRDSDAEIDRAYRAERKKRKGSA